MGVGGLLFFSCQLSPGSRDFFFFPLPDNKDIIRSKMQWLRDGSGMVSSGSYVFSLFLLLQYFDGEISLRPIS